MTQTKLPFPEQSESQAERCRRVLAGVNTVRVERAAVYFAERAIVEGRERAENENHPGGRLAIGQP